MCLFLCFNEVQGSTFTNTLELSQLYVAPIFNLFDATWIQGLPKALVAVPQTCFFFLKSVNVQISRTFVVTITSNSNFI